MTESALTVTQLNREARYLLEDNFPSVLVEGEISNIATPASGHWYLTLKDNSAQVRCAMFRNRNQSVRFKPRNGSQVLLKAKLSLYEGRGDYQLIVERMEELGDGALRQAYEELKERLFKEGLFEEGIKQEIPTLAKHIAVITSPTGAAIKDIISVFKRRFPATKITILPVSVQGQSSALEMTKAVELANQMQGCLQDLDVIIIGRGGGSLEDLWSFNDEGLARAIFASKLPVVSAVGHEVDFTIADFVADLRAATPSAAAELLSPDQQDYFNSLFAYQQQFAALMREQIRRQSQQLNWLGKQLKHPGRRLQDQAQKLDELEAKLKRAFQIRLYRLADSLKHIQASFQIHSPLIKVQQQQVQSSNLRRRLNKGMQQILLGKKQDLAKHSHALNTVNPLSTLSRGYSIAYTSDNKLISQYDQVKTGDTILTHLHHGSLISTVESVSKKDN